MHSIGPSPLRDIGIVRIHAMFTSCVASLVSLGATP